MGVAGRRLTALELFGVRAKPRNACDKLLDVAIDLFASYGFHAVGLDQIIEHAGVTKTTFYKHFESKDDLIVRAIEKRDRLEAAAWARAVKKLAGDDPRAQLLATFDVLDTWFNDPAFGGCIFISAAAEFADAREPAHQVAARYKKRTHEGWRATAKRGGAADPDTFADLYATLVEGTLIMRHVHGRNDAAKRARPLIERLVNEYIPARQAAMAES